jgi:hypothetical protein
MLSVCFDILEFLGVVLSDYFSLPVPGKQTSLYLLSQPVDFSPPLADFLVQQHRPVQLDRLQASELEIDADPARRNSVSDKAPH